MTDLSDLRGRVAVVGSGVAGLMTALALAPEPVVLVTRSGLGQESSSLWAQGGIAACVGADDSTEAHLSDTLSAGAGLCDASVAAGILSEGPEAIAALESHGVRFDRDASGAFALGLEAAHSRRRILHGDGDGTGAAITRALSAAVLRCPSVTCLTGVEASRLLVGEGAVTGLLLRRGGTAAVLDTARVVMATGGIGGLFDATTNPASSFGQGVMMAARAGARLADMEFVQFHPTALDVDTRPLPLVSEAVRGEGAVLVNARGERIMADIPGAELAPRDVVARAIFAERARGGRVFLDARGTLGARFAQRFPGIARLCHATGIDPAREPVPVRPAAHYHMGGIATDALGRSSLRGLWAVGECAATGLHGANRLASNSLLEAVVMARRAARDVAGHVAPRPVTRTPASLPPVADPGPIRALVSRELGVQRDADGLGRAIAALLPLAEGAGSVSDPAIVALSLAVFAALRRESRGAHARADHPRTLPEATSRRMTLAEIRAHARTLLPEPILLKA